MKKILILSGINWNDTLQRHQRIAKFLANNNYQVYFIENIISSKFTIKKAWNKIFYKRSNINIQNEVFKNIKIYNKKFLNPHGIFKPYNHIQVKKLLNEIGIEFDVIINYLPIETTNYILKKCKYRILIYDCVRDFQNWGGYPKNIQKYEKILLKEVNWILVDSYYLKNKIAQKSNKNIIQILPTIDLQEYKIYKKIYDRKIDKIKKLTYFGTIGEHIDIELLNYLTKYFKINIIGKIDSNIKISDKIKIYKFENNLTKLAEKIINISDALIIPYKGNMDGVIPAKLMQSLATGLPVFVSKFYDSISLNDKVYIFENKENLKEIIKKFNYEEFIQRKKIYENFIKANIEENSFEILNKKLFL